MLNPQQFNQHPGVNINQQALKGMEGLSHPGAPVLAKGYQFTFGRRYGTQNVLSLGKPGAKQVSAELAWQGKHDQYANRPGEIESVLTKPASRRKGLAEALFKVGNEMDLGQDTVPVHSTARTPDGVAWSQKVGGYGPNSKPGDNHQPLADAPHPYKQQPEPEPPKRKQIKGQEALF
jgi:hypothetical protein